jgi:hypothetical protein
VAAIDLLSHPGWLRPRLPLRAAELPAPPQPGFFLLRTPSRYDPATKTTHRGKWLIPAIIYRPCPFVQPDDLPFAPGAPDPEDWCRRTARSRPLCAMIGGVPREEGQSWGDRCSAAQQVWEWGRQITAAQYEDALREYAEFQLR